MMTIQAVLNKYHKIEIELLLAHVLRKPKEFLYLYPQTRLTRIQANRLTRMAQRRMRGEPMAYILGYKDFYGLRFKVNRNVLIPRPETETLVNGVILRLSAAEAEESQKGNKGILRFAQDDAKKIRILDVGTGSGNIVISLAKVFFSSPKLFAIAKNLGGVEFYASDISTAALKVARQNAKTLLPRNSHTPVYGRIRFIKSNLLANIKGDFDIIIANLPYLSKVWKLESVGLKFEPARALFAKEKGLMIIRRLLEQIAALKYRPKLIYLEFDPRQKLQLLSLIKKFLPWSKIKFYKDYNGWWRYAEMQS